MSTSGQRRTKVVIVAPVLPYKSIPHAGGVYLQRLHETLAESTDLTFLVHDIGPNRDAIAAPGAPDDAVLLGSSRRRSLMERLCMWAAWNLDPWLVKRNPTWPPLPLVAQLVLHPRSRAALKSADVIDVQWPEYARLLPLVRVLNPGARRIATLHDVLSQRWSRQESAAGPDDARVVARAARSARRIERAVLRQADTVVVFSEKDRDLLHPTGCAVVEVIAPPLARHDVPPRHPDPSRPTILFVSMLDRRENDDAAQWLVREIWPLVIEALPGARLRLVGRGASDALVTLCEQTKGVELAGFVPELAKEYVAAGVCVIPLRFGAGVKFKTIEALVAGVPTVTTSVGAEGIAGPERFAALTDDPAELSEALIRVVSDPTEAEAAACVAQEWARERYSLPRFQTHVEKIYEPEVPRD